MPPPAAAIESAAPAAEERVFALSVCLLAPPLEADVLLSPSPPTPPLPSPLAEPLARAFALPLPDNSPPPHVRLELGLGWSAAGPAGVCTPGKPPTPDSLEVLPGTPAVESLAPHKPLLVPNPDSLVASFEGAPAAPPVNPLPLLPAQGLDTAPRFAASANEPPPPAAGVGAPPNPAPNPAPTPAPNPPPREELPADAAAVLFGAPKAAVLSSGGEPVLDVAAAAGVAGDAPKPPPVPKPALVVVVLDCPPPPNPPNDTPLGRPPVGAAGVAPPVVLAPPPKPPPPPKPNPPPVPKPPVAAGGVVVATAAQLGALEVVVFLGAVPNPAPVSAAAKLPKPPPGGGSSYRNRSAKA